jgi:hypothetical protein
MFCDFQGYPSDNPGLRTALAVARLSAPAELPGEP